MYIRYIIYTHIHLLFGLLIFIIFQVDEDYIEDKFNLTGLNESNIPNYKKALDTILDINHGKMLVNLLPDTYDVYFVRIALFERLPHDCASKDRCDISRQKSQK